MSSLTVVGSFFPNIHTNHHVIHYKYITILFVNWNSMKLNKKISILLL